MRFAARTFLWSFLPFASLLLGSFWVVRTIAGSAVRDNLRSQVRENQRALVNERARDERQNRRILQGAAENSALEYGLQLLRSEARDKDQARSTVEDQLSELGDTVGFDYLTVASPEGRLLAGVIRGEKGFSSIGEGEPQARDRGFFMIGARAFYATSVPVQQGDDVLGTLTAGERFDWADAGAPAVLIHDGSVVASSETLQDGLEGALRTCKPEADCEVRAQGATFLSVPLSSPSEGYVLRSVQSIDAAGAPVQAALRKVFLLAGLSALGAALAIGFYSSRSVARPLTAVVESLRESARTGELPVFGGTVSRTPEIRALTNGFNQAAAVIQEGRENLLRAYVEFTGSLASALDARDPYTAGHSRRVSEYSCAIARAMKLGKTEMETIRVGALLHDLGKIGISDVVLQKPGRLSPEELALIQEHPVIGRRILEGVHGFEPYLDIVELHHENWDGTGYPKGLKGEETPLEARIVKVADAYDALTSDRPYRNGASHEAALAILERCVGTQLDSEVMRAFVSLPAPPVAATEHDSLRSLAEAIRVTSDSPVTSESRQT